MFIVVVYSRKLLFYKRKFNVAPLSRWRHETNINAKLVHIVLNNRSRNKHNYTSSALLNAIERFALILG